jgi:hypothetical protein
MDHTTDAASRIVHMTLPQPFSPSKDSIRCSPLVLDLATFSNNHTFSNRFTLLRVCVAGIMQPGEGRCTLQEAVGISNLWCLRPCSSWHHTGSTNAQQLCLLKGFFSFIFCSVSLFLLVRHVDVAWPSSIKICYPVSTIKIGEGLNGTVCTLCGCTLLTTTQSNDICCALITVHPCRCGCTSVHHALHPWFCAPDRACAHTGWHEGRSGENHAHCEALALPCWHTPLAQRR